MICAMKLWSNRVVVPIVRYSSSSLLPGFDSIRVMPPKLQPIMDLATANQKQITRHKIHTAIKKHQKHQLDTGSSAVQIAVLTEKINNLARHFTSNRKDYSGKRGFQKLISKRRQLMRHLRRYDFPVFVTTIKNLGLEAEARQLPLKI